jgi:hypothetical protein
LASHMFEIDFEVRIWSSVIDAQVSNDFGWRVLCTCSASTSVE